MSRGWGISLSLTHTHSHTQREVQLKSLRMERGRTAGKNENMVAVLYRSFRVRVKFQ